jgi:hypothetical protein
MIVGLEAATSEEQNVSRPPHAISGVLATTSQIVNIQLSLHTLTLVEQPNDLRGYVARLLLCQKHFQPRQVTSQPVCWAGVMNNNTRKIRM